MTESTPKALTILRRKDVQARTGLSRSTIYSKMQSSRPALYDPTFPKPISLGAKCVGWIEAEIEEWIASQIKKSRGSA